MSKDLDYSDKYPSVSIQRVDVTPIQIADLPDATSPIFSNRAFGNFTMASVPVQDTVGSTMLATTTLLLVFYLLILMYGVWTVITKRLQAIRLLPNCHPHTALFLYVLTWPILEGIQLLRSSTTTHSEGADQMMASWWHDWFARRIVTYLFRMRQRLMRIMTDTMN